MKRSRFYITVGLMLSLVFLLSACGQKKRKDGRTDT
ncbi:MAG: phosphate-binding protein, partial [Prevotella fusca]